MDSVPRDTVTFHRSWPEPEPEPAAVLFLFAFRFVAFWVNSLAYVSLATRFAYQIAKLRSQNGIEERYRTRIAMREIRCCFSFFVFGLRMRHRIFVAQLRVSEWRLKWVKEPKNASVRSPGLAGFISLSLAIKFTFRFLQPPASCVSILFIFSLLPLRSSHKHEMLAGAHFLAKRPSLRPSTIPIPIPCPIWCPSRTGPTGGGGCLFYGNIL